MQKAIFIEVIWTFLKIFTLIKVLLVSITFNLKLLAFMVLNCLDPEEEKGAS